MSHGSAAAAAAVAGVGGGCCSCVVGLAIWCDLSAYALTSTTSPATSVQEQVSLFLTSLTYCQQQKIMAGVLLQVGPFDIPAGKDKATLKAKVGASTSSKFACLPHQSALPRCLYLASLLLPCRCASTLPVCFCLADLPLPCQSASTLPVCLAGLPMPCQPTLLVPLASLSCPACLASLPCPACIASLCFCGSKVLPHPPLFVMSTWSTQCTQDFWPLHLSIGGTSWSMGLGGFGVLWCTWACACLQSA